MQFLDPGNKRLQLPSDFMHFLHLHPSRTTHPCQCQSLFHLVVWTFVASSRAHSYPYGIHANDDSQLHVLLLILSSMATVIIIYDHRPMVHGSDYDQW